MNSLLLDLVKEEGIVRIIEDYTTQLNNIEKFEKIKHELIISVMLDKRNSRWMFDFEGSLVKLKKLAPYGGVRDCIGVSIISIKDEILDNKVVIVKDDYYYDL